MSFSAADWQSRAHWITNPSAPLPDYLTSLANRIPASSAINAPKKNGAEDVLVIERDVELGGILLQCIHNGFGVEILKRDLPGPAYAQRYVDEALGLGVETLLDTMVLDVSPQRRVLASGQRAGCSRDPCCR